MARVRVRKPAESPRAGKGQEPSRAPRERISVLLISGPNLDRLGSRQPEIYGTTTLAEISQACGERGASLGADVTSVQTHQEGDIVQLIGDAESDGHHAIVLNAGGYTHTSVAILDAILGSALPVIEVHLSNPEAREDFRHRSILARGCVGKIAGFGPASYELAVDAAVRLVRGATAPRSSRQDRASTPPASGRRSE
ncbi:MAG: type II 3-dehydroquinate dehydratase [Polyangiaceae bacterium]